MKGGNRPSLAGRTILFLLIVVAAVVAGHFIIRPPDSLPVYHPKQLDRRLVDPQVLRQGGEHRISGFQLTDQRGRAVTLDSVEGKVIVADFFFTTCPTICPKMSAHMARVQDEFQDENKLMLLSHSVTPEKDTPEVLQQYATLYDASYDRWRFLTGDRRQIYDLARRSYFAAMDEGDGGPDDFVHTENFVLVDSKHRIRGFYDGTSEKDVDRLIKDLKKLLKEEKES